MDYKRELFKYNRVGIIEDARATRTQTLKATRQTERFNLHDGRRSALKYNTTATVNALPGSPDSPEAQKPADAKKKLARMEKLKLWKAEKEKKMAKALQKPVFKVGIIHTKATGSPLANLTNTFAAKNYLKPLQAQMPIQTKTDSVIGVVTRARAKKATQLVKNTEEVQKAKPLQRTGQKRVLQKAEFLQITSQKKIPVKNHPFVVPKAVSQLAYNMKITIPQTPPLTKSNRKLTKHKATNLEQKVYVPRSKKTLNFVESGVPNMTELENKMGDLKTEAPRAASKVDNSQMPQTESIEIHLPIDDKDKPVACEVAGSLSKQEEMPIHYSPYVNKVRGSQRFSVARGSQKKTIEEKINQEEKEFQCRIFSHKKYLECETKRLLEKCEKWHALSETRHLPTEIEGEISAVIGKTKLLTSDKFKQFKELISKCEGNDPMIKIDDLQGFQDWVALEVDKVDSTFCTLDQMQQNGFATQGANIDLFKPTKGSKHTKPVQTKPTLPKAGSNMRAHILAARKMMKQNATSGLHDLLSLETASPKQTSTPKKKQSLVDEVRQKERRRNSGLEVMAVSQLAKTLTPNLGHVAATVACVPQVHSNTSMVYINQDMTPGKGILKALATPTPRGKTPRRLVTFSGAAAASPPITRISEKYFTAPAEDTHDSLGDVMVETVSSTTPTSGKVKRQRLPPTPMRRSSRLLNKSVN